jgi:ketosteroid isomerase-like protein
MNAYAAAIRALDVQRVLGYFGDPEQFRFIDNGTVYSHAELKPMVQGLFGSLRSYEGGFGSIHVNVLNHDAAVADAPYTDVFTDTTGVVTRIRGVVTWVWVRTPEGWRIVHGQAFGAPDSTATP